MIAGSRHINNNKILLYGKAYINQNLAGLGETVMSSNLYELQSDIMSIKPDTIIIDLTAVGLNNTERIIEDTSQVIVDNKIPLLFIVDEGSNLKKIQSLGHSLIDVLLTPVSPEKLQFRISKTLLKKNEQYFLQIEEMQHAILMHDVRGMASIINSFSGFMTDEFTTLNTKKILKYLQYVYETSNGLVSLLDQYLLVKKEMIANNKIGVNIISLHNLVIKNLKLHQSKTEEKHISIRVQKEIEYPIIGSEYMIDAVIRNVISNAIKYTPVNGIITIRLYVRERKMVIEITDSGKGISQKKIVKLLNPDSKFSQKKGSHGIGLFVSQKFLEINKGIMEITSTLGKGSTFSLVFNI